MRLGLPADEIGGAQQGGLQVVQQAQQQGQQLQDAQQQQLTPGARKIKMANIIDQADDAEIVAWDPSRVDAVLTAYRTSNGGEDAPVEDECTCEQLSALDHKIQTGASPACDFAVWRPFGRRLQRALKLTVQHLTPGGDYVPYEVPGPPTYDDWLKAWRVFAVAMVCLQAATASRLTLYQRKIAHLAEVYGEACWWLVAQADSRMRFEQMPRILRRAKEERAAAVGAARPHPLDPNMPWDYCFKLASLDKEFWDTELDRKAVLYITHLRSQKQLEDDGTGVSEFQGAGSLDGGSGASRRRGSMKVQQDRGSGQG